MCERLAKLLLYSGPTGRCSSCRFSVWCKVREARSSLRGQRQAASRWGQGGSRIHLSRPRRRRCIDHVRDRLGTSERRACRVLGQRRSTQRRIPGGRADEDRLVADVIELARQSMAATATGGSRGLRGQARPLDANASTPPHQCRNSTVQGSSLTDPRRRIQPRPCSRQTKTKSPRHSETDPKVRQDSNREFSRYPWTRFLEEGHRFPSLNIILRRAD